MVANSFIPIFPQYGGEFVHSHFPPFFIFCFFSIFLRENKIWKRYFLWCWDVILHVENIQVVKISWIYSSKTKVWIWCPFDPLNDGSIFLSLPRSIFCFCQSNQLWTGGLVYLPLCPIWGWSDLDLILMDMICSLVVTLDMLLTYLSIY